MGTDQEIRRGFSLARDPVQAAREFHAAVSQPRRRRSGGVLLRPGYDLDTLAAEMARLFAGTPLIGCTTAGEIGPDGYVEGSITGFSLPARTNAPRRAS